jgi:hypothetical protein
MVFGFTAAEGARLAAEREQNGGSVSPEVIHINAAT